jgi:hypothetical protein
VEWVILTSLGFSPAPADISDTVAVGDNAIANVGDDLHVGVAVKTKACSRRNLVIVPNNQRAQGRVGRIAARVYCKVMLGLEPTKIPAIERR